MRSPVNEPGPAPEGNRIERARAHFAAREQPLQQRQRDLAVPMTGTLLQRGDLAVVPQRDGAPLR
jgi:hypothetical protein